LINCNSSKDLLAPKEYMKTSNKSEKVVEKATVKYLANKKTNPFGEAPLWIPDIGVSSILCSTLLSYDFISRSFLPYKSLWFPVLADYNPLSLYSTSDEMKNTFSAAQRVTLLKCLQYQDDQDSPGYMLYKGDWVAKRTLILEYFNPDQPTMIN
jgi:hypothetical protein